MATDREERTCENCREWEARVHECGHCRRWDSIAFSGNACSFWKAKEPDDETD